MRVVTLLGTSALLVLPSRIKIELIGVEECFSDRATSITGSLPTSFNQALSRFESGRETERQLTPVIATSLILIEK